MIKLKDILSEIAVSSSDRIHLSVESIWELDKTKKYTQKITFKPSGIWYAFGTAWKDWVRSEMPEWNDKYSSAYKLDVDSSKILSVKTVEELQRFHDKYSEGEHKYVIDWNSISQKWAGIEFPVYLKSVRLDYLWYSQLDVASGCIWDTSVIRNITPIDL